MSWLSNLPVLLAQADAAAKDGKSALDILLIIAVVLAILIVPFVVGKWIGKWLRMPEHDWKIGLVLLAIVAGGLVAGRGWPPNLGIDLKGGTYLVYEFDTERQFTEGLKDAELEIKKRFNEEGDDDFIAGTLSYDRDAAVHLKITLPTKYSEKIRREKIKLIEDEIGELELQGGALDLAVVESSVGKQENKETEEKEGVPASIQLRLKAAKQSGMTNKMIEALVRRINPGGQKEISIRSFGPQQIEIKIPDVGEEEVERIKKMIHTAGVLEFRVVANRRQHQDLFDAAERSKGGQAGRFKGGQDVRVGLRVIGRWVKVKPATGGKREPGTVNVKGSHDDEIEAMKTRVTGAGDNQQTWALMAIDKYNVTGSYLTVAKKMTDRQGNRGVSFEFGGEGANLFGRLTSDNQPDTTQNKKSQLAIILDGKLLSAPSLNDVITDSGQITGDFSEKDQEFLVSVLDAGSLPTALRSEPIAEETMSAELGDDMVRRAIRAMILSMSCVLVFMLFYYRFAGMVACFALLLNLLLILAIMIVIQADFTLPGLAGLVLTVGMAVDANVLIFERIREETTRGATLRMAIRNGFAKAMTTIIDANITTLLVAIVLYAIGRDQIRGFAVTLFLGIVISMFTAIFCSRIVFDVAERKGWITKLRMMRLLGSTNIDFIGKRMVAGALSVAVIVIGLVGVVARGGGILDIDFTGGVSVNMMLDDATPNEEVRNTILRANEAAFAAGNPPLLPDVTVVGVGDYYGEGLQRQFKVETSLRGVVDDVSAKDRVRKALVGLFGSKLRTYTMTPGTAEEVFEKAVVPEIELPKAKKPTDVFGSPDRIESTNKKDNPAKEEIKKEVPPAKKQTPVKKETPAEPAAKTGDKEKKKDDPARAPPVDKSKKDASGKADEKDDDKKDATDKTPKKKDAEPAEEKADDAKKPADDDKAEKADKKKADDAKTEEPKAKEGSANNLPADTLIASTDAASVLLAQADNEEDKKKEDGKKDDSKKDDGKKDEKKEEPKADAPKADESKTDPPADVPKTDEAKKAPPKADLPKTDEAKKDAPKADLPKTDEAKTDPPADAPKTDEPKKDPPKLDPPKTDLPKTEPATVKPAVDKPAALLFTKIDLEFKVEKIAHPTLEGHIQNAIKKAVTSGTLPFDAIYRIYNDDRKLDSTSTVRYEDWTAEFDNLNEAQVATVLKLVQQQLQETPVFRSSTDIGGRVAGDTQTRAIGALLISLLFIVGYIWIRFQRVTFGLAAVVALVHDVLVTLGAIAISHWAASAIGFLQVDSFKISLSVLAAFLTIIGYSLNDTIVVFDRIREVRGKSPNLSAEMINTSINQTLSRTLLTSITTLIVVLILYFIGGQGIHAFAFALVVGVMVGTYSSIFVASPALLWMTGASEHRSAGSPDRQKTEV
jgi:SecD/SecF fusion protein